MSDTSSPTSAAGATVPSAQGSELDPAALLALTVAPAKGHATGNDFILHTDPDAALELSDAQIQALTNRHTGIGGDGVIRAVRTQALAGREPTAYQATLDAPEAEWFMDYRNADGSIAEMCGNGVRLFARYLAQRSLIDLPDGGRVVVGTRAGALGITREGDLLAVDMGRWSAPGGAQALADGMDALVNVDGIDGERPGLRIEMPNPHVVIAVATEAELQDAVLLQAPGVEPVPSHGTNVEIIAPLGEVEQAGKVVGVLRMRVHERGVGETLSCGTGACAAAIAARVWAGPTAPCDWVVHVPGGQLAVRLRDDQQVVLVGPAVLVADLQGSTSIA